ncbi:hypothetical protein CRYPA_956 [uncultured Candidatus Thioglobus sp.]|nr:hypothetical protein CRYPA_956 [uncultured Candidatus Thioglobus sp.]
METPWPSKPTFFNPLLANSNSRASIIFITGMGDNASNSDTQK